MSGKLDAGDAAEYICALRTDPARRECIRFWRDKHGNGYALAVLAVIKRRHPNRRLGLDVSV